jgi:hypothetical protein
MDLTECEHLGLGLTVGEDNNILILLTLGENAYPTHGISIPLDQAIQVATSFGILCAQATALQESFAGLTPEQLAAEIEETKRRFVAGMN